MEQFNNLIKFRQATYDHGLIGARDAQFELLDALLLHPYVRSFAELSLSPAFRRQWPSLYVAMEEGQQDREWLESYFIQHVPREGIQIFALDGTAWPHPAAKALADRQYVYSPTAAINGGSIVVGHPYSVLAWVPDRGSSWAPPLSVRRVTSDQTAVDMGAEQVKKLCQEREDEMKQESYISSWPMARMATIASCPP